MTIQINRDAVLYVLSQPPQPGHSAPTAYQRHYHAPHLQPYDDEAEIEVNPSKEEAVIRLVSVSSHNASSVPRPQSKSKPDVREAPIEAPHRVKFADELVSDVWTRPRTPPGDLRALFYSYEETQRFRQEYRIERNRMAEADPVEDPAAVHLSATEPFTSADTTSATSATSSSTAAWQGPLGDTGYRRHHISRVVIRHHDTLATFYDATYDKNDSNSSDLSPTLPGAGSDATGTPTTTMTNTQGNDGFFDNDSFWSGSITWY
mmetsp:Transcript_3282/g.5653  ORF Transcript_3282/g.5653 Transcript_3282/m.5653 type:complete len:262 (-) Transcript_3282:928-1713(-)